MLCGFGWVAALVALGFAAAVRVRLRSREELVARACHELRSPLTAARLAVHALGAPDPATFWADRDLVYGRFGAEHTETLRAFTREEAEEIVRKL